MATAKKPKKKMVARSVRARATKKKAIPLYDLPEQPASLRGTSREQLQYELACAHEAGHAVAAILHRLSFRSVDVLSTSDMASTPTGHRAGGMVAGAWDISDRRKVTRAMSALLAGGIGADAFLFMKYAKAIPEFMERRFVKASPGTEVDMAQVTEIAKLYASGRNVKSMVADIYERTLELLMSPVVGYGHYQVTRALIDRGRLSKREISDLLDRVPNFPVEGLPDAPPSG